MKTSKDQIKSALQRFNNGNLAENARHLLNVLGYHSQRIMDLEPNTADEFLSAFNLDNKINEKLASLQEWESVDLLFQLMGEQISDNGQVEIDFGGDDIDKERDKSYLFFALKLCQNHYTRTQLSQITREMTKPFKMPVMILLQHGDTLTFAVIDRRLHKRKKDEDVLEKATLIRDINFADPHPAHIDILFDLSIAALYEKHKFKNFPQLHEAWKKTLDTSELNKRFYKEIANWYFWAVNRVTFPEDAGEDVEVRNATSVIRLITRLIFVWFIKEKGLVSNDLFDHEKIKEILINTDPKESSYYKAIIQNLFFATLNQEMNTEQKPNNRKFRNLAKQSGSRDQNYMAHSLYRYEEYFKDKKRALDLFGIIPFLNGGLFECLDKEDKDEPKKVLRVDSFSDHRKNPVNVPNFLFFSDDRSVDLNAAYGTSGRGYKVRGLINILDSYKFTIAENTPIEEEVALDPELLGKVFENLIAAYNPDTGASARKQSGSYYTPREIVNYMTDESLIAYLKHKCIAYHESQTALSPTTPPAQLDLSGRAEPVQTQIDTQRLALSDEQKDRIEANLRNLLVYHDEPHRFNDNETEALINAVDTLKILDPACGSGAFPMGVLHKLVFILGKLDPRNQQWRQRQIDKVNRTIETAEKIDDSTVRENTIRDIEREIDNINEAFERNELDYGRKLYLIENCIYGVDIQPIAVQIAKLRFFISLVVDQKMDDSRENRGVRPLPNLETKFVAANTLLSVEKPAQLPIRSQQVVRVEKELSEVRRRHFTARTPRTKEKYRKIDRKLRKELSELLKHDGFPDETTEKIANWDLYDQNATADFFDSEWMFGITHGFDAVIGNPPYVRQEKIKELKTTLKSQYDCYTGTADLYVYFYERGFQLLRDNGILTYISSNKYLRAAYGKKLRDFLARQCTVSQLIDFGDAPVFASIAYPSIITASKTHTQGNHLRAINWDRGAPIDEFETIFRTKRFTMPQDALIADSWQLAFPVVLNLLEKLRNAGKPLGEYVKGRFYSGIKTGLNEAFVVDREMRDKLIAEHSSSAQVLKPFLRGRDVKRWQIENSDLYLCYVGWGLPIKKYPAIYAQLKEFEERLKARSEVKQGRVPWYALSRYASDYWQEFEKFKIVYPDIAVSPQFAYDESGAYGGNTMYIVPTKEIWLLGLLNSKAVFWFYTKTSTQIRGGFVRFIAQYVSQIPIPIIKPAQKALISKLVNKILAAKRTDPDADVSELENEIDQIVYSLYNLTPEEIAIVENV